MPRERLPLAAAVALCLLLVPVELGWVSPLAGAWGLNLWQYLPPAAGVGAAALVALLCWGRARQILLAAAGRLDGRRWGAAALVAAPAVFWLLREREFFGDSRILMYAAASGVRFRFPDVGATWLFHLSQRASEALGVADLAVLQALVCLSGGLALYCFARLGRELAPGRGRALLPLILCGGVLRVFFGHVEVYAFVLLCAGAYLWAACAYLHGRAGWSAPAAALGVGLWIHPSFAALLPSLLAALWLRGAGAARTASAVALAAAPLVLFAGAMLAAGHEAELAAARQSFLEIAGVERNPQIERYFVGGFGHESTRATDYALFSGPHLKYLANAFFVLAPAALPVLAGFALFAPRRFAATPEAVFLTIACAGLLVYCLALRPVWGPYDWDLFSLCAVGFAALAALLLAQTLEAARFAHLTALLVGASLLFVTLPLVRIGLGGAREAGPFALQLERAAPDESAWELLERQIGPWL